MNSNKHVHRPNVGIPQYHSLTVFIYALRKKRKCEGIEPRVSRLPGEQLLSMPPNQREPFGRGAVAQSAEVLVWCNSTTGSNHATVYVGREKNPSRDRNALFGNWINKPIPFNCFLQVKIRHFIERVLRLVPTLSHRLVRLKEKKQGID